jgi:hypothetical protein
MWYIDHNKVYSTPSGSFGVTVRAVIKPNTVPSEGKIYSIVSRCNKVSDMFLCTLFENYRLPKQIFTVARMAKPSKQAARYKPTSYCRE